MPTSLRDQITHNEKNGTYAIQCMAHGFCGFAKHGSELEKRCIQREKDGLLDALPLSPAAAEEVCDECIRAKEHDAIMRDLLDIDLVDNLIDTMRKKAD
jgi:hypothetical protein